MNRNYQTIKRIIDLLLCLALAPFLLVLGIAVAIAVRLDSPGPIFFVQKRVGKGSRVFNLIKFRTLHEVVDDEDHRRYMQDFVSGRVTETLDGKATFKPPFDPRQITQVGSFLRKTSLDEFPQLLNVLKGEMSLVGPRPNVCWEVEAYKAWHLKRLDVLPGITGLAQVRGRSQIAFDEIVGLDIEYIEKQSLVLDLKILWWTAAHVFFGQEAE